MERLRDEVDVSADLLRPGGPTPQPLSDSEHGIDVQRLYRTHWRALVRLGCLLLDDRSAAEDAVQDAFASLYQRRSQLREPDAALSYLRATVVNRTRSVHRRRYLARRRTVPPDPDTAAPADAAALLKAEHGPVLRALARLPRRQREVLVLRYWSEASEAEIAAVLGISAGTVKSSASRGLAALRAALEEER